MKKKLAFLMASVMTLSLMPTVNSYASSDNRLSNGNIAVSEKTMFYEPGVSKPAVNKDQSTVKYTTPGSYLELKLNNDTMTPGAIVLDLQNAKFAFNAQEEKYVTSQPFTGTWDSTHSVYTPLDGAYDLTVTGSDSAKVTINKPNPEEPLKAGTTISIPLVTRMNEDMTNGSAKVTVQTDGAAFSGGTYTFASISKGSTNAKVTTVQTGKNKISIDEIVIEENVAGSMNPGKGDGFYLELPSGYTFSERSGGVHITPENVSWDKDPTITPSNNNRKYSFTFSDFTPATSFKGKLKITGLDIIPNSSSDTITKEDVKINIDNIGNSDMVTAQEFLAGTRADYSMSFKTDGTVPTLLNGFYDNDSLTNDRTQSVKVIVAEETAGSLINGGDLVLTLSDSAKINAVKIEDTENIKQSINGPHYLGDNGNVEVKDSKVTLRGISRSTESTKDKAKFTISFYLSVESGYVGDVTMSVSGDAIRSTSVEPVVIAKMVNPLNATAATTYFTPGQTVELGDIVLTEQMNSKGYSSLEEGKTVTIGFNNNNNYLSIVGTPTIKTENGLTVKNIKTTNTSASGSALSFTIDDASSKNKASKITITGLKVAASSATPEGTYDLVAGGSAIAGNSTALIGSDKKASFATDGMTIATLSYGGKVAMKITIGDKMVNVNGQNVEMKLAPFIDAKTGTTYMQVSDIVKATGKTCTFFDNRVEKVEGMDKNLFVTFGDRTFEKDKSIVKIANQTIPETMTNEQGQAVNMIIKDDYTCIPLRYFVEKVLNQKINWNGTDNTITVE